MKGYDTFYRIRLGDYRIGIEVLEDKVILVRILHRKDIYRYFP
ncbi:MAG: type II toxin-antitoxin system RelE/ParE family toxin [Anaerolineae bacterium]